MWNINIAIWTIYFVLLPRFSFTTRNPQESSKNQSELLIRLGRSNINDGSAAH